MNRVVAAYSLMATYVVSTSLGLAFFDWRAGFVAFGILSGHVGYLLGKE